MLLHDRSSRLIGGGGGSEKERSRYQKKRRSSSDERNSLVSLSDAQEITTTAEGWSDRTRTPVFIITMQPPPNPESLFAEQIVQLFKWNSGALPNPLLSDSTPTRLPVAQYNSLDIALKRHDDVINTDLVLVVVVCRRRRQQLHQKAWARR